VAFVCFKACFDGAIGAVLRCVYGKRWQGKMFAQLLAQLFTKIGHIGTRLCAFLPQPLPYLAGTKFLFTHQNEKVFEFGKA
jgi:hypothetical protein